MKTNLDVTERERELVVVLILDGVVGREFEVVVSLEGHDVGEEVAPLKGEILHDKVDSVVGVLDARDGDVADLWQR